MVVSKRELFTSLVLQVKNKLRIFAVLAGKDVFAFEHGCVETAGAERREALLDNAFYVFAAVHLAGTIVTRTLRT